MKNENLAIFIIAQPPDSRKFYGAKMGQNGATRSDAVGQFESQEPLILLGFSRFYAPFRAIKKCRRWILNLFRRNPVNKGVRGIIDSSKNQKWGRNGANFFRAAKQP